MNNAPDYNNNLAFAPKDTNFDTLKEYEAHGETLPSYENYIKLKDLLEKAMDDVYQMSLVNEDSRELLMQIQEVLK